MKHAGRFVLTLALVAMCATLSPPVSHGQAHGKATAAAAGDGAVTAPPTEDSWVGGAAAIGCGFGIRVSRFMPYNGWVVGGTVVMCLIMLADGIRS